VHATISPEGGARCIRVSITGRWGAMIITAAAVIVIIIVIDKHA